MVKLNQRRIRWLINKVIMHHKKPKALAPIYGITERRVQQLVKEYRETKKYPELKKNRRPRTDLTDEQKKAIDEVYAETKLSPKLLYYELKRRGKFAPKNKIYAYLKSSGKVKNEPKKQKKRKRCRYERKHSGSLVHGDFHRTTENHPYAIFWLDDASRKILAAGEFNEATTEHAIATFQQAERELEKVGWRIEQVNTDKGTQFFNSALDKHGNRNKSKFELYLEEKGIEFIPSRRKNPPTNGKVERRWLEYDRHRWRFNSLQEWVDWYNNRLTTALDIEFYETPNKAFIRKLPNFFAIAWGYIENGKEKTKKY